MLLSKRKLSPWFLFALLLILGWISFRIVAVFIDFVLVGLFIAFVTHPVYDRIMRVVRNPSLAAFMMMLVVTVVLLVPLAFLLVELAQELRNVVASLDAAFLETQLDRLEAQLNEFLGRPPPAAGDEDRARLIDAVLPNINSTISTLAARSLSVVAEGLLGVFVLLYVMFYTYTDGHAFVYYLRELLPMQEAHRDLLFHELGHVTKAVMYGLVFTAVIQAVLGGIGFAIFGIPNVVLWSVIMFVLALLPIVGPPLVWAPWGIHRIITGNTFEGVGLIVYSAVMVSGLDNIVRPKLIGSRASVHSVVILLGVLGGVAVFGFSGLVLGPLVLSIFVTILSVYQKEFALKDSHDQ